MCSSSSNRRLWLMQRLTTDEISISGQLNHKWNIYVTPHHHHHTPGVQVLCREVIVRLEDPQVRKAQSEAMFFENDKTVVRVHSCCDCPHKIIPVNTVHSGGRVKLMPSQRNFFKEVDPGRATILQWMVPHLCECWKLASIWSRGN